jgi:hypothetical protein
LTNDIATRFRSHGGNINNYLKLTPRVGVEIVGPDNQYKTTISISYKLMREVVFDKVVKNTLDLIERQVNKANGNIKRTYLVGGFGCSPYLQKRIKERFTKNNKCEIGELVVDTRDDTAAMKGALYYGIDSSRIYLQPPDIILNDFETGEDQFNTLVCLGNYLTTH